jgi:hypothetical protein
MPCGQKVFGNTVPHRQRVREAVQKQDGSTVPPIHNFEFHACLDRHALRRERNVSFLAAVGDQGLCVDDTVSGAMLWTASYPVVDRVSL